MLTISRGHSAEYLLGQVATGRESYYSGAVTEGEPPGRWYGAGAEHLGLRGEVEETAMEALYSHFIDPRDERFLRPESWHEATRLGRRPMQFAGADDRVAASLAEEPGATPERRAEIRAEATRATRQPLAFLDATFNVPKSITVVHAAFERQEVEATRAGDTVAADSWRRHRLAVEAAIWSGNRAALDYLQERAGYTRVGYHSSAGAGRYDDAHEFTVASFFQHDNRAHDPHLHIHNAILNRVRSASDGRFRTLDSRAIHRYRGAASSVGDRVMEEQLSRTLGLQFATRPDGQAREIVAVPQAVMDLFSTRHRQVAGKVAELAQVFQERYGRAPNALELSRLGNQAYLITRGAKSSTGETLGQRLDRWDSSLRAEVAGGLAQVAETVLAARPDALSPERFSPDGVIAEALAEVQGKKAAWNRSDLVRAIDRALPDHLGLADPEQVRQLVDGLADMATAGPDTVDLLGSGPASPVPDEWKLADGRSSWEAPAARVWATQDHVAAERTLREATVRRGAAALPEAAVDGYLARLAAEGVELGPDQVAAVRGVLTSGAMIETLVGPAGTGKSYTLGVMTRAWSDRDLWQGEPGRLWGLAASQVATDVLTAEGLQARNIRRWLAAQQRLDEGRPVDGDAELELRRGDGLVVDESAMASTADVAAIHRYAEAAGVKMLLTGDHRQLAAVGAGGAMSLVADAGISYELADVRRFSAAWEREASLRLRDGDVGALEEYRKRGRVVDGGTAEDATASAARGWLADTVAGRSSLLVVDTNEQAAQVSSELRAQLVELGRVEEAGVPVRDGNVAGVGDLVQARRNDWDLSGWEGNTRGPINRETYRVVEVRPDGGLVADRVDGPGQITLPAAYVAGDLSLGYASTVHSAQGRTVDTTHSVVTGRTSGPALYVGATRGRDCNTVHVATVEEADDSPPGQVSEPTVRDPQSLLADIVERHEVELSAVETQEQHALTARSTDTAGRWLADAAEQLAAARTAAALDRLTAAGEITDDQRRQVAADHAATGQLSRLLRRAELAGWDPDETLADAARSRSLDGVQSVASVLHERVSRRMTEEQATPVGDTFADRLPATDRPQWREMLATLAETADQRARELGADAAADPPAWARQAWGSPPEGTVERLEWEERAGRVAAYREMAEYAGDDALGPAPRPGQVEHHAAWHSAWRALDRPEADRDEATMSPGQLRVRVRAWEREDAWGPTYVADEMAGTSRTADVARQDAALAEARDDAAAAGQARARAVELDGRMRDLERLDADRATWYVETSATRAAADRARVELVDRGEPEVGYEPDRTTAEQWLAAHAAAVEEDERHRPVHAEDLDDAGRRRAEAALTPEPVDAAETGVPDIRETAAAEPPEPDRGAEGVARVARPDDIADDIGRARAALAEVRARQEQDAARIRAEAERLETDRQHAAEEAEQDRIAEQQESAAGTVSW